jgi:hypothetical protein
MTYDNCRFKDHDFISNSNATLCRSKVFSLFIALRRSNFNQDAVSLPKLTLYSNGYQTFIAHPIIQQHGDQANLAQCSLTACKRLLSLLPRNPFTPNKIHENSSPTATVA